MNTRSPLINLMCTKSSEENEKSHIKSHVKI